MENNYNVTSGHALHSAHRFRKDVHHMIVYEDLEPKPTNRKKRTRLFLDDEAYQTALRMEQKGWICILADADVVEGHIQIKGEIENE